MENTSKFRGYWGHKGQTHWEAYVVKHLGKSYIIVFIHHLTTDGLYWMPIQKKKKKSDSVSGN